jgi:hypothetical protein
MIEVDGCPVRTEEVVKLLDIAILEGYSLIVSDPTSSNLTCYDGCLPRKSEEDDWDATFSSLASWIGCCLWQRIRSSHAGTIKSNVWLAGVISVLARRNPDTLAMTF